MRIEPLVKNAEPFCSKPEDCFKVWPTNRDRPAFNAVMSAQRPIDYETLGYRGERMVEAHRFFSERAHEWLRSNGPDDIATRAETIETVVRELLQIVVIDLAVEENAQEIFETLNARGAQLTAADLIKNFIFQRLLETGTNVEDAYQRNWKEFETGFWETEISVGRLRYPRSSIFLNHWLVARTGEEVVAREVFDRFKRFVDHDARLSLWPVCSSRFTLPQACTAVSSLAHRPRRAPSTGSGCSGIAPESLRVKLSNPWYSACSIPKSPRFPRPNS
jgi:hypothetical protein